MIHHILQEPFYRIIPGSVFNMDNSDVVRTVRVDRWVHVSSTVSSDPSTVFLNPRSNLSDGVRIYPVNLSVTLLIGVIKLRIVYTKLQYY